jgi:dihydrodipicolinate synthase/N-acetylneuraminate lyase
MPAAGADAIVSVVPYYNKAGLYDASGDAMRPVRLRLGMDFRLLSGDDAGALAHLARGEMAASRLGRTSPPASAEICTRQHGQSVRAQRLARPVAELTDTLFRESNPIP